MLLKRGYLASLLSEEKLGLDSSLPRDFHTQEKQILGSAHMSILFFSSSYDTNINMKLAAWFTQLSVCLVSMSWLP